MLAYMSPFFQCISNSYVMTLRFALSIASWVSTKLLATVLVMHSHDTFLVRYLDNITLTVYVLQCYAFA